MASLWILLIATALIYSNFVVSEPGVESGSAPQNVQARALSPRTVIIQWDRPKEPNGQITGYEVYFTTHPDLPTSAWDTQTEVTELTTISGLTPHTTYTIRIQALTSRGPGPHSAPVQVTTQQDVLKPHLQWSYESKKIAYRGKSEASTVTGSHLVPSPRGPELTADLIQEEPTLVAQVQWSPPTHIYGPLIRRYKLRFGRSDTPHREEREFGPLHRVHQIPDLDRGARYEFYLSAKTLLGWGEEAYTYLDTPEGVPTAPPQNVSRRLQSPTGVVITWGPPPAAFRNGRITHYSTKIYTESEELGANTTETRMVFSLVLNTEYTFQVCAHTSKGAGPWSPRMTVRTPGDAVPAPTNVQAVATSDQSVEVWWDQVPDFLDVLGYEVFYIQLRSCAPPVEDLDKWSFRSVPLTWSAELAGLEIHAMYAVSVAARTRQGLGLLSELITVRSATTDVPTQLRAQDNTTDCTLLLRRSPSELDPIKYKAALNRRIQLLKEDLERSEERLEIATQKLEEASQAADENERIRKGLENCTNTEDDRMYLLATQLVQATLIADGYNKKYEKAEARAEIAERSVQKLQKEVDRLKDEILAEREKNHSLQEEVQSTQEDIQSM